MWKYTTDKKDEQQSTEASTNKDEPSANDVEQSTDKNEPSTNNNGNTEICEACGNPIVSDSYKGDMIVGDYCDGRCNQWYGDINI